MKMFILGFLLMSVFSFIGLLLFDNNKEDIGIIFSGPVSWIVVLVCWIDSKLRRYLKFRNVRSLLVCPDGWIKYIDDKKADTMRGCVDRKYDFPDFDNHPEWDANDWAKHFVNFRCGNVRYAPKKVWSQYEKISKEEYKYAKKHQRED